MLPLFLEIYLLLYLLLIYLLFVTVVIIIPGWLFDIRFAIHLACCLSSLSSNAVIPETIPICQPSCGIKAANMDQRVFWMITLSNFSQCLFYRAKSEGIVDC